MPWTLSAIELEHVSFTPEEKRATARLIDALAQNPFQPDALMQAAFDCVCEAFQGEGGCVLLAQPRWSLALAQNLATPLHAQLENIAPAETRDPVTLAQEIFAAHGGVFAILPIFAKAQIVGALVITSQLSRLDSLGANWRAHAGAWIGGALDNARKHFAFRQSSARMRDFIEGSTEAFVEQDLDGKILYVNDAVCRMLEMPRERLLELNGLDLNADRAWALDMRHVIQEKGSVTNQFRRLHTGTGKIITVNYSTRLVSDSGQTRCWQTIFRDVTEQQQLVESLNRRNRELAVLNEIANILSRPFELEQTLTQVCEQIATIIGMETVAIHLMDAPRQFLNLRAHWGLAPDLLVQVQRLGLDDSITRQVAIDGQPFAIDDVMGYAGDSFAGPRALGYHAGIGVPIRQRGEPRGAIFVGSKIVNRYQPADVDLLLNIGNQIGGALDNANLYLQMQKRLRELDGLARLSANLVSTLDVHAIADHTIECLQMLFDGDVCTVRLLEGNTMRLQAAFTRLDGLAVDERLVLDDAICAKLFNHLPFVINDAQDPLLHAGTMQTGLVAIKLRAAVAVPFFAHNKLAGAFGVLCVEPHHWETGELELAKTIANQVGLAIEKADLYTQTQDRVRELEGLMALSVACTQTLDQNAIFDSMLGWTQTLFKADIVDLRRLRGATLEPVPNGTRGPQIHFDQPVAIPVLGPQFSDKRTPLIINDVQNDPQVPLFARQMFAERKIHAILTVPLIAQGEAIGILSLLHASPRVWSSREIELLKTIANQTANAIYNAQLFQQVLEERGHSKAMVESCLNGLYVTDCDGRILDFNHAATQMTGWRREEALGNQWQTIFGGDSAPSAESLIAQVVATRQPVYPVAGRRIRQRYGALIPVLEAAAPLLDERGKVTRVVGTFWDLSRERQAELERAELLEFFMHELGTPLTALSSATELLDSTRLRPDKHAELLGIIKTSAARVYKFAQDFLNNQNAFAPLTPVELSAVPVMPMIQTVVQRFRVDQRSHRFRIKSPHPPPIALADRERLEHVLGNLIENAVNYSPDHSLITVTVQVQAQDIEIAVQDQGGGIALEEQELVFQRYYRAKHSRGRVPGHGLGLAMVRKMVTEMQGKIWVESQLGQGATFRFTLKRHA